MDGKWIPNLGTVTWTNLYVLGPKTVEVELGEVRNSLQPWPSVIPCFPILPFLDFRKEGDKRCTLNLKESIFFFALDLPSIRSVASKLFCLETPLILKNYWEFLPFPKSFSLCRLYLLIFTTLEIKISWCHCENGFDLMDPPRWSWEPLRVPDLWELLFRAITWETFTKYLCSSIVLGLIFIGCF